MNILNVTFVRALFFFTLAMAATALITVVILFTLIVVRIRRHSVQRAALGVGGQDGQHLTAVKMFSLITIFAPQVTAKADRRHGSVTAFLSI